MRKYLLNLGVGVFALILTFYFFNVTAVATPSSTNFITLSSGGSLSNGTSAYNDISKNGQFVLFSSTATNLVSGDTNGLRDLFIRDTVNGTTERVNLTSASAQITDGSGTTSARMSGDARFIVFESDSTSVVSGDTNGVYDIFIRDRQNGTTELVSKDTSGTLGNGNSSAADVSDDGRFVSFGSYATNLVSGDTNAKSDVFVRDRTASTTTRVSVSVTGAQANDNSTSGWISCDGRYLTFGSAASNLVSGDTNSKTDIFYVDRIGNLITDITISGDADSSGGSISCNGKYVNLHSSATNLVASDTNGVLDTFLYKASDGSIIRTSIADGGSEGNGHSVAASVSEDGRYVFFLSTATNLISGDTNSVKDAFVRDLQSSTTTRMSVSSSGTQANNGSISGKVSEDGHYVSYSSDASNLVSGDTNSLPDIFITDTGNGANNCVQ